MTNAANPKMIGNYQIIAELGRGGMGVVYKAFEPALQRTVALKMLGESVAHQPGLVERFYREARAMAALSDPNVVQIHAVGEHAGQPYFVMEFVAGESLGDRLKRERLSIVESKRILLQAARGLHAAHEVNIVHRDIKPGNLMLTQKGLVKVTDFGIALGNESRGERLTGTGGIVGTPGYLSPEACLGEPLDARTDIFALGVVTYEMLTGRLPFDDKSPFALMAAVVQAQIPDVRTLNKDVDQGTIDILQRMLARRPAERYQSCAELVQDLETLERGQATVRVVTAPPMPNQTGLMPGLMQSVPTPVPPVPAQPAYLATPAPPAPYQQPAAQHYQPTPAPPTNLPYGQTPYGQAPAHYGQTPAPPMGYAPPYAPPAPSKSRAGLAWTIGLAIVGGFIGLAYFGSKKPDGVELEPTSYQQPSDPTTPATDPPESNTPESTTDTPEVTDTGDSQETNDTPSSGTNSEIVGSYTGTISGKDFKLVLQKNDGGVLTGYNIAAGSRRPVAGRVVSQDQETDSDGEQWNIYSVDLEEPGDSDYDGKFALKLKHTDTHIAGDGTWTGFKNSEVLDINIENYSTARE
jgi:eukaryotic-like serine/threonine-protein kinase